VKEGMMMRKRGWLRFSLLGLFGLVTFTAVTFAAMVIPWFGLAVFIGTVAFTLVAFFMYSVARGFPKKFARGFIVWSAVYLFLLSCPVHFAVSWAADTLKLHEKYDWESAGHFRYMLPVHCFLFLTVGIIGGRRSIAESRSTEVLPELFERR
jgi:hypothetical protein